VAAPDTPPGGHKACDYSPTPRGTQIAHEKIDSPGSGRPGVSPAGPDDCANRFLTMGGGGDSYQ